MLSAKTLAMPAQQIGYNLPGLGPLNTTASPTVKWAYATGNVVRGCAQCHDVSAMIVHRVLAVLGWALVQSLN